MEVKKTEKNRGLEEVHTYIRDSLLWVYVLEMKGKEALRF